MSIPGLPSLPPSAAGLFSEIVSLAADAITGSSATQTQWGIYLNGEPVVTSDNVVSVDFRQDFTISNYPIEQGAFASYNKVQHPFEVKVGFSTGGSDADRQVFLASIAAIISDTNLYDFVTPEAIYSNVNITHQDYRINASNVGLRVVEVWCEEVRPASLGTSNTGTTSANSSSATSSTPTTITTSNGVTAPTSVVSNDFSDINSPQSPDASPQVNGGTVQPVTPTAAQNSQFSSALTAAGNPFND
jgi:hypothetical protein